MHEKLFKTENSSYFGIKFLNSPFKIVYKLKLFNGFGIICAKKSYGILYS